MPSPIGHVLAGLSIGLAADASPKAQPLRPAGRLSSTVMLAALVAALPDADLVYSPIHRMFSHSLGATALIMIVTAAVTGKVTGRVNWRLVWILGAAHASHIVLDWLGSDPFKPAGLQALWPFSRRFYISGWDVFPPTERRLLSNPRALAINLRALLAEIVIVGPFVVAAWAMRTRRRRRSRDPISVPDILRPPFA